MKKINVGIIGATGYVGVELIRLLSNHKNVKISALGSNSFVDEYINDIYCNLGESYKIKCTENEKIIENCDFLFTALPHGVSEKFVIDAVKKGKKVVDLGADFRLKDEALLKKWYGVNFLDKELHEYSVYGLCEIYRDKIKNTNIIANPGCYVTSVSLPLMVLLKENLIKSTNIIADCKSGVTGAGRGLSLASHYTEINENIVPYKIGSHRHTPEIEQNLSDAAGKEVKIIFTPILIPVNRGILSTIYCDKEEWVTMEEIHYKLAEFYKNDEFVEVLPLGKVATIKHVKFSNKCVISLHENNGKLIICSAIDNMIKGSAGQAIQNMNIMCGFEENEGLSSLATAF